MADEIGDVCRDPDELPDAESASESGGVGVDRPETPAVRLGHEQVEAVVRAHQGEVRACYEQGLASEPTLAGRVVVGFRIGPDGGVTTSIVHRTTTLGSPEVETCVADAVRRWTFPAPPGGTELHVRVFVFDPGGTEAR